MAGFMKFLCIVVYLFTEQITYATKPRHPQCGEVSVSDDERVIGGYEPRRRAWPWVVSLSFGSPLNTRGGHICGGTLLNLQWVLTAAHCVDTPGQPNKFPRTVPKQWRVIAGMYNRTKEEQQNGNWQTSSVKRFIYHKGFQDYTLYSVNDIALVHLAQPFTATEYVRPICLPPKRTVLRPGWNKCYIAGWGTNSENSTMFSQTLQEVPMFIVRQSFCQRVHTTPVSAYRVKQHICGGDWFAGNKDACKGDSGGPLACQGPNNSWHIAGIISWGVGCGRVKTPGVYTNVRTYLQWINHQMRKYTVPLKTKIALKSTGRRRRSITYTRDSRLKSTGNSPADELTDQNLLENILKKARSKSL